MVEKNVLFQTSIAVSLLIMRDPQLILEEKVPMCITALTCGGLYIENEAVKDNVDKLFRVVCEITDQINQGLINEANAKRQFRLILAREGLTPIEENENGKPSASI